MLTAAMIFIRPGYPVNSYESVDEVGYLYATEQALFTDALEILARNDAFWAHIWQERQQLLFPFPSRDDKAFFSPGEWATLRAFFQKTGPDAVYLIPYGDPETPDVGAIVGVDYLLEERQGAQEASTYSLYYVSSYGNLRETAEGQEDALSQLMHFFQHGVPKKIGKWWYELVW